MIRCGYGTYMPSEDGTFGYRELLAEVKLVEAVGLDGVYFSEHHGMIACFPNPLATALYFLGATTRLRVGSAPLLLPLHNPVRVAEDAALGDRLSGGRLVLGVGAGFLPADFDQIGIPVAERGKRFEEGLEVIKAAWSGKPVEHRGPHYHFVQQGPLVPMPLTKPGPTLWVAAGTPWGYKCAARYGDALLLDSMRGTDEVRAIVDRYRQLCAEAGRPAKVVLARRVWIGDRAETDAYLTMFRQEMRRYLEVSSAGDSPWTQSLRAKGPDDPGIAARAVVGTVPEVAERLAAMAEETGADYFLFRMRWHLAKSPAEVFRTIERAGEVAALLRK